MPDWDADSPQLRKNLAVVLQGIALASRRREPLSLQSSKRWQTLLLKNLTIPHPRFRGTFRGEPGMEDVQVRVGPHFGVDAAEVAAALADFETMMQALVAELDARIHPGNNPDADQLAAILDTCAWIHSEWVRIHPFANANGRTARLWANSIAMRYGLPPFIRLRPRPNSGYRQAAANAMRGDWQPTALVFRKLLNQFLAGS